MSLKNICNICGSNYEYKKSRWVCPGCGAYKEEELSPEEATLLYGAAQKLRLSNFSEAEEAYTDIIEKYPQNANAYWGRLLSKYGIKYEEDFDGRKIPTCYAASIESVTEDDDYKKAIEFADTENQTHFTNQASYIERVRKEWIEKASKEEPYDVFLCYKESDREAGIERTADSVAVQDLYIHLTSQGYRVFYSRESLREKVGEKYEPYIFNALSTAKVMLVYGSSAEYIKSTWLKNEWHRFYKKIASGEKHQEALLIACDGFSPNELPTILSSKQCFDAQRKTFFLDLDKCIKRIIQESPKNETPYTRKEEKLFSGLHEHKYKTKIVKSTCIAKGYTLHKCDCGYEYRDSYTPLVDHKFKIIDTVSPTCTSDGREEKVCEICGEKTTSIIPALGHQFAKWVEVKHPNCTEDGEEQRRCTRCGETETKVLPKTNHNFGGWTVTPEGKRVKYCNNCGISQEDVHYGTSKRSHDNKDGESVIAFRDIIRNYGLYHKQYFTKRTTLMQKIEHLLGYSLTLAFMLMWVLPIIAFYHNNPTNSEEIVIPTYWVFVLLGNAILMILAYSFGSKEKKRYLEQGLTYPANVCSRVGMLITSRFLLVMSAAGFATMAATNQSDRITGLMMGSIFGVWTIITVLYTHCPKEYKRIRFKASAPAVPKSNLSIMGVVITFVLIVALGVAGGISEVASEEDLASISAQAEELYLSGNASEAASLLKRYGIEENYEAYSYVAKGEYKKSKLENIVIPNGTVSIEQDAFKFYDELKSITIPDSVTSIGESAFDGCDNLTSVTIPDSVTSIGDSAFHGCKALENIIIGNGVVSIGYNTFNNCAKLKHIVIGSSVTSIGNFAFSGCKELVSLTIPTSVTSIGMCAFTYCDNLTNVIIPKEVTNIGEKAFFDCKKLANINYCGTEQQWSEITKGFNWDKYSPGWLLDYEPIQYTITFNYVGE